MILTTQQSTVIQELIKSIKDNYRLGFHNQFTVTIGGYAGTGKTTIISELRKQIKKIHSMNIAFVTFTGKASSVLNNKLKENDAIFKNDYCGTIHSLIYKPETRWDKKIKSYVVTGWVRKMKDMMVHELIIIDEASMISEQIWNDLLTYKIPIIAFGDHGQLPPIGNTNKFQLMDNPDFNLTQIHRQALNSPIIKLSKFVREEGYIPYGYHSNKLFKFKWNDPICQKTWNKVDYCDENLQILCGFNTTRANLNDDIRKKLSHKKKAPYPGEKIVCLSNNHNIKIMNGQIGKVLWVMSDDKAYRITLEIDTEIYECYVSKKCFGEVQYTIYDNKENFKKLIKLANTIGFAKVDYFDYGYVISVHKSQGSEWDKIILFEQRTNKWSDEYYAKWLYTAITRAKTKLFVISDAWI